MSFLSQLDALDENKRAAFWTSGVAFVMGTILSFGAVVYWLVADPTAEILAEVPGLDGKPTGAAALGEKIDMSGVFESFGGSPSDIPGSWPSFRGAGFDNIVTDGPELASSWGEDGPKELWSVEIGGGYAAPSILNGVVYLMDYDEENRADLLRAFSLEDGKELWRRSYKVMVKRNHGMSRTIPAVTEDFIVTIGPKCHVVCLDTETGEFLWGIDLQADYGTEEPLWYAAQCPLIVDGNAIIAPAGDEVLMMSVDCETGDVLWTTPNPRGWKMSHASIIPMTVLGTKMYVYSALGGISGVSAEEDSLGKLLWQIPWGAKVLAPSAVQAGDDMIFITAGYASGNMMLKISESGGEFEVEAMYSHEPGEGMSCEQQTPIFNDGFLYGIMPKDAGALKMQFVCYRPDGSLVWSSGSDRRFGFGPFILADDKFYILDDHGTLTMLDATTQEYVQLGEAHVLDGHDPWGPIALVGTRMFLRDMDRLICVDVGAV